MTKQLGEKITFENGATIELTGEDHSKIYNGAKEGKTIAELAKELIDLKDKIDLGKTYTAELQSRYDIEAAALMNLLESSGLDSFKAYDFTFFTQEKESVRIPKDDESKQQFFAWLKAEGLFDSMISVNSQTLNSLYKAKSEEALKAGVLEFRIPGIDEATTYRQLKIRKA